MGHIAPRTSRAASARCAPKRNILFVASLSGRDEPPRMSEPLVEDARGFGAHRNRREIFHVANAPGLMAQATARAKVTALQEFHIVCAAVLGQIAYIRPRKSLQDDEPIRAEYPQVGQKAVQVPKDE